jgi:hypothetical protein
MGYIKGKIMPTNINTKISASTFQQCDGSNFTTAGVDASVKVGSGSLSSYVGVATSFTNGSTGMVVDFKGSMPYGESAISGGFRIRNRDGSSQFRIQPSTVTIPIGQKTSIYATPYVVGKLTYATGDFSTNVGAFAGVSQKIGNVSVFVEGQIYDATKINTNTTSINVGVSVPIK